MSLIPYQPQQLAGILGSDDEPLFWTPSAEKDLVERTTSDIELLKADAASAPGLSVKQLEAVLQLASDWNAFKDNLHFWSYYWYGPVGVARDYQKQVAAWRDIIRQSGGATTGPGPSLPKPGAAPDWLKWAVFGAAIVGGTYVAAQALGVVKASGLPKLKNPFRARRRRRHR